jgi:putative oxidoreductase
MNDMKYLVLIGRILYSTIFLMTAKVHFSHGAVEYATAAGVPLPEVLVPLSGIVAIIGGLSIALGFKAKNGAWLIVIFLIPVTFYMHAFWKETDAMRMQMQFANFFKNMSMLGAALMISYFGSGPLSLDAVIHSKPKIKGFVHEENIS